MLILRKYVTVIFVLFWLDSVLSRPNEGEANEITKVYNERSCLYQGGVCRMEEDCPDDLRTAIKGLCPDQRYRGVECCYWDPKYKPPTCASVGGECFELGYCSERVHARNTIGCTASQMCCILV